MKIKQNNVTSTVNDYEIVSWGPKYSVGIKLIDDQHMELVNLTNQLYQACLSKEKSVEEVFKEAMHRMVDYVRMHFSTENLLLESVGFPNYREHKKLHETLVKDILTAVKNYEDGNKLVPIHFARTLKDWIFSHIAICDQIYAQYIHEQVKNGVIDKKQLE